jgi:hypothetical protein
LEREMSSSDRIIAASRLDETPVGSASETSI